MKPLVAILSVLILCLWGAVMPPWAFLLFGIPLTVAICLVIIHPEEPL